MRKLKIRKMSHAWNKLTYSKEYVDGMGEWLNKDSRYTLKLMVHRLITDSRRMRIAEMQKMILREIEEDDDE